MAQKRPSYVSIRVRKVKLLKYMGTTGKTESQTARDFGVSREQLRRFITQDPKQARRSFNRSPVQRQLYEKIGEASTRPRYRAGQRIEKLRGTQLIQFDSRPAVLDQIRRTPGLSEEERSRRLQVGTLIQRHYTFQDRPEYAWAEYAREHRLPTSINAIKTLYRNGRIDDDEYNALARAWKDTYNITDAWFTRQFGDISEEDVA